MLKDFLREQETASQLKKIDDQSVAHYLVERVVNAWGGHLLNVEDSTNVQPNLLQNVSVQLGLNSILAITAPAEKAIMDSFDPRKENDLLLVPLNGKFGLDILTQLTVSPEDSLNRRLVVETFIGPAIMGADIQQKLHNLVQIYGEDAPLVSEP